MGVASIEYSTSRARMAWIERILHEHREKNMCFCNSAKEFEHRHAEDVLTEAGLFAAGSL